MNRTISPILYRSEEMDLTLVEQAIKNIIDRGSGAAGPAITANTLNLYLGKEYAYLEGNKPYIADYARVKAYKYVKEEPILALAVMHIINKYFNQYDTDRGLYYAPKSVPAKQVYRWLYDDLIGTMENPAY